MTPGTLGFDESEHAGPEHLDADYVAGYDRKAATDPSEDVQAMRDAGIGERSVVVDLGAGTGTFAAAIAPWCREIVAVDVSAPMRAATGERCRSSVCRTCVAWRRAFSPTSTRAHRPAGVYSRNALHHLPDFWKAVALTRIAGFLAPGGVLRLRDLVYSFEPLEAEVVLERWYVGASPTSEVGWTRAELEEHVRTEFSSFSWILEPMLERCGFEIRAAEHAASQTYAVYTCIRT